MGGSRSGQVCARPLALARAGGNGAALCTHSHTHTNTPGTCTLPHPTAAGLPRRRCATAHRRSARRFYAGACLGACLRARLVVSRLPPPHALPMLALQLLQRGALLGADHCYAVNAARELLARVIATALSSFTLLQVGVGQQDAGDAGLQRGASGARPCRPARPPPTHPHHPPTPAPGPAPFPRLVCQPHQLGFPSARHRRAARRAAGAPRLSRAPCLTCV